MPANKLRALLLAGGLVAWSTLVDPRLPARWQPVLRAALGTGLVALTRAPTGLQPARARPGLRWGGAAAVAVTAGTAATTAVPAVRAAMRRRELPSDPVGWLALRIPIGTVWAEETTYRAALANLGSGAFGPRGGRLLQAVAFGLSHIADARATGAPVIGTVLVTGGAGWVFGWLADRSGGLAASMLTHLALNEAGALAVLFVRRR
ncbi:abortive phage infection protein [Mycobacterium sp. 852013-50091_SCH5140682]|uniref:Rv0804 family intramembrane glutamic endopeptidase n=1 Tax=Mycobacterium sp. 852013-50091_SCH5140682 TaxID=1834109 RepID=UPI0007EA7B7E|nr:CPBP family intramembrane glutamic endopeptidase [Mycobacterium sp. 852013-50091_SCH5140682]OBC16364.1 abortive phage infection protein [Mycobacterium sp. 852013-50091_SCH5140682]